MSEPDEMDEDARWLIDDDGDEDFEPCELCGDEHPSGVMDDGRCPACVDVEYDGEGMA